MSFLRRIFRRTMQESVTEKSRVPEAGMRRAMTEQEVQAMHRRASTLHDQGDYAGAISLYDTLLEEAPLLVNTHELRKCRAICYCKVARFSQAKADLQDLLDLLRAHGAPTRSSQVMYWYLVAKYEGDEKRAMREFVNL